MGTYEMLVAISLTTLLYTLVHGTDDVTVEVTAPVNPAEEDGIFSIRCQVKNLGQDQEVVMVRIPASGGKTERLTLEDKVVAQDDRMFLALRQLEDSSLVYFLSIMRVTKADAGEYRCAVYEDIDGSFVELKHARATVDAEIMYFPAESEPHCDLRGAYDTVIMAGTELTLNCSSDMALPTVAITWSKGSPDSKVAADQISHNGKTYSVLKVTPKNADTNLVYLCTISSTAFPERTSTCHVGPFTILPNPNLPPDEVDDNDDDKVGKNSPTLNDVHSGGDDENEPKRGSNNDLLDAGAVTNACAQECPYTDSTAFYWVIATVVAAILAIFFLIIGIVILLRYCRLQEERKVEYTIARQRNDQQIYAELDSRRGEKVYMYLDKNPKTCTEPLNYTSTPSKEIHEHYGIIPHVPKV